MGGIGRGGWERECRKRDRQVGRQAGSLEEHHVAIEINIYGRVKVMDRSPVN